MENGENEGEDRVLVFQVQDTRWLKGGPGSYAIVTCRYHPWQPPSAKTRPPVQQGVFCGTFFSLRPYYIYTARCHLLPAGRWFVKRFFFIQKEPTSIALYMKLVDEATGGHTTQLARADIHRELVKAGGQLNQVPDVHKMTMTTDYYNDKARLAYAQIFVRRCTARVTEEEAAGKLAVLGEQPIATMLTGAEEWDTEQPNIDMLINHYPAFADRADELRLVHAILTRRHQTGQHLHDSERHFNANYLNIKNLNAAISGLMADGWLVHCTNFRGRDHVYALAMDRGYYLELCRALARIAANYQDAMANGEDPVKEETWNDVLGRKTENSARLCRQQIEALRHVKEHAITIVMGNPGTGKTTLIRALVKDLCGEECVVETFIGYLANRLASKEVAGMGFTCHTSIAGYERVHKGKKRTYTKFSKQLAGAHMLIIDEFTVLSTDDMLRTLKANITKDGANKRARCPILRLVLLGDPNQIQPIGSGQPGKDMGVHLPSAVVRLTINHRVQTDRHELIELCDRLHQCTTVSGAVNVLTGYQMSTTQRAIQFYSPMDLNRAVADVLRGRPLPQCLFLSLEKTDVAYLSRIVNRVLTSSSSSSSSSSTTSTATTTTTGEDATVLLRRGRRFMIVDKRFMQREVFGTSYTSDEVRNGQFFTVKRLFKVTVSRNKNGSTWDTKEEDIDVVPRQFEAERGKYVFVDCEGGIRICVHPKYVDPQYIDPSYAATVNKLQGSEAPVVLVYVPDHVAERLCWNADHVHVFTSRAKELLILVCNVAALAKMAARYPEDRPSPFVSYLPQLDPALDRKEMANVDLDSLLQQLIL